MVGLKLLLKLGNRPAWSPYDIPRSILKAWWNADDHGIAAFMTDDGAGLISSWTDRISGVVLAGAGGARPTWASGSFTNQDGGSNKAALTFDRTANALTGTTLTNIPATSASGVIWTVAQATSATPGANQTAFGYGVNSNFRKLTIINSSGKLAANDNTSSSQATVLSNGVGFIAAGQFDAAATIAYLNGTAAASSPNTLNTTNTRMRMGASPNTSASEFFGGPIRHCLVTGPLITLQRQQLEGWFAWDSGLVSLLPSDHPYKNAPP